MAKAKKAEKKVAPKKKAPAKSKIPSEPYEEEIIPEVKDEVSETPQQEDTTHEPYMPEENNDAASIANVVQKKQG